MSFLFATTTFKGLKLIAGLCFMILSALTVTSCDVHQFPEPPQDPVLPDTPTVPDDPTPPEPDDPDLYVDLNLNFYYTTEMYLWEHYYDPKVAAVQEQYPEANVDGNHPGTTEILKGKVGTGLKHITAQFYRSGNSSSYNRLEEYLHPVEEGYDLSVPIKILPGHYDIVAFSDLRESEVNPRFYDTSNFHSIKIDYNNYKANNNHRDTFRGMSSVELGEDGDEIDIIMRRPMAKYEFVTTDLSEFLDKETERRTLSTRASLDDYTIKIYYSTYHPSAYSAMDDRLENSIAGVSFTTQTTVTGESEASLGFDYVFINDYDDAGVQATIVVYDANGETVAQSNQITVPLRRDHHTLLRGAFLTMNGSGGVGIDPGFDGDHNVIW